MKFFLKTLIVVPTILITLSCANSSEKRESPRKTENNLTRLNKSGQNLNISFLLDLSDRINPQKYPNESMEYYLRDVAYIKSVTDAFMIHLKQKKVREIKDKIQLYFDPAPQNQNINEISNRLSYDINRNNISLELLDELNQIYTTKPIEIYDLAIKDNNYVGSDTWRFFKTKIKDYCIEEDYRNILIILTDGYIYHKDTKIKENNLTSYLTPEIIRGFKLNTGDWKNTFENYKYGFIPATEDLSHLEILVLGINPDKTNPYEEDVIMKYWGDWFDNMKVGRYEIKTSALPSNMDKVIKDYILKE